MQLVKPSYAYREQPPAFPEHTTVYIQLSIGRMKYLLHEIYAMHMEPTFFKVTKTIEPNLISGNLADFYRLFNLYMDKIQKPSSQHTIMHLARLLNTKYPDLFKEESYPMPDISKLDVFYEHNKILTKQDILRMYQKCKPLIDHHITHTIQIICDSTSAYILRSLKIGTITELALGPTGSFIFLEPETNKNQADLWNNTYNQIETLYDKLRVNGIPQSDVNRILPNSAAVKLIMTATKEEWKSIIHFCTNTTNLFTNTTLSGIMTGWQTELEQLSE